MLTCLQGAACWLTRCVALYDRQKTFVYQQRSACTTSNPVVLVCQLLPPHQRKRTAHLVRSATRARFHLFNSYLYDCIVPVKMRSFAECSRKSVDTNVSGGKRMRGLWHVDCSA